jgi:hypothetical protein
MPGIAGREILERVGCVGLAGAFQWLDREHSMAASGIRYDRQPID